MATRTVLFGYGNPSRGDDALGPLLLERAEAWLTARPALTVAVVGGFQLQIEHALDLQGMDLALFLDADARCRKPYALRRVRPARDASYSSHELSPAALLEVCREVSGREPPPAYILAIRGERFGLGEPLSPAAARNLDQAWSLLQQLLLDGYPGAWETKCQGASC
jgi:hydrogenase maturation protease